MKHVACLGILSLAVMSAATGAEKSFALQQHFARGVYWPWERTKLHADHAGMEKWAFVDHMMARIANDWHCNLIWFVNGPDDPARVCDLAEKHGLKVLSGTKLAGIFVHGLRDEKQLDDAIAKTVELAAKPALGAYVLKDEAKNKEKAQQDSFRAALAAADPTHPSIVVTMTGHTEAYATDSGFPIICTDIYHFGGPRSPAIPNPAPRSRGGFRGCVNALTDMTARHGKTAWSMPQAFTEIWGASWMDENGHMVIEPGSYWHWRMPAVAEIRWQIWESVRADCKGVVFFSTLLGGSSDWTPAKGPMPEKMKKAVERNVGKWPLVSESVNTREPACLTGNGGTPTPQSDAMAAAFTTLEAHDDLLMHWRPARMPCVFAEAPASVRTFVDPRHPDLRYAVVVNADTDSADSSALSLSVLPTVASVHDMANQADLPLSAEPVGNERLRTTTISLEPGGGTILQLRFTGKRPGFLLFDEDFGKAAVCVELEGCERKRERRGFGMGHAWRVRKSSTADEDATITLAGLQEHRHGSGSPLIGAMRTAGKGTAMVHLAIDAYCPKPESVVVQFVNTDGKAGWNKTDAYHLPIAVPADTDEIRIRLTPDAAVNRVRLWRMDLP